MSNIISQFPSLCAAIAKGRLRVVATDVDDTLTKRPGPGVDRSKINLVNGVLETLIALADLGIHVVIASARPLDVLQAAFGMIPNVNFISNDGCVNKVGDKVMTLVEKPDFANAKRDADAFAERINSAAIAAGLSAPANSKDMGYAWGIFLNDDHPEYEMANVLLTRHANDILTVKKHPMGLTLELRAKPGKKNALADVLCRLKLGDPFVIYTGDAQNDVEAQQFVKELDGLALKIVATRAGEVPAYVNGVLVGADNCAEFYKEIVELLKAKAFDG